MIAWAELDGRRIVWSESSPVWRFQDTGRPVSGLPPAPGIFDGKPCLRCGRHRTPEGHDACLGRIEGAVSACCGHGAERGFVLFADGLRIDL